MCRRLFISVLFLNFGLVIASATSSKNGLDTTYLKPDSSLYIINSEDINIWLVDTKNKVMLYHMGSLAGRTKIVKKSKHLYYFIVQGYFPVPDDLYWKPFEVTRFVLFVKGNEHSFYEQADYANYPKLNQKEIDAVLREAQNPFTHSFVQSLHKKHPEEIKAGSYLRNIGFLSLAAISGSDSALALFNKYDDICTGGEGCEAHTGKQQIMAFLDFELWIKSRRGRHKEYFVKRK